MAQGDYLLELSGVEGETAVKSHEKHFHINSWHFGVSNQGSGDKNSGSGTGKAIVHDMHLTKHMDSASPRLFASTFNGKHFDKAVLHVYKSGEKRHKYLEITMKKVFFSGFSAKSEPNGGAAESFTLNFVSMEIKYTKRKK